MQKLKIIVGLVLSINLSLYGTCIYEEEVDIRNQGIEQQVPQQEVNVEENITIDLNLLRRGTEIPCADKNGTQVR